MGACCDEMSGTCSETSQSNCTFTWKGPGTTCGRTELACNDDSSCGLSSQITAELAAETTYLVRVSGYGGQKGNFVITVTGGQGTCGGSPPPDNDECVNAICVENGVAVNGTTINATGTDITNCAYGDAADVWYSYTPAVSGSVTISMCGSSYDTTLAIFNACGSCMP